MNEIARDSGEDEATEVNEAKNNLPAEVTTQKRRAEFFRNRRRP